MTQIESVIHTTLERLAPLPDGSRRDWADVLERAQHTPPRRRRRRLSIVLAGAVAILALPLLAGPALGIPSIGAVFGDEPTPTWTWPQGVPGERIRPPKLIVSINESTNGIASDRVDLRTVRQIVSAGSGNTEGSFLAARGVNGDVCLARLSAGGHAGAGFACLHDPPKRGVRSLDEQAVMIGMESGGHRGSVVDYATLIGVVRADVGRAELQLADGETIDLPLNRWRAFGYYATDPRRFPKTLSVYRTWTSFFRHHAKLVGQLPLQQVSGLEPTPLCGGRYGPCPPGVKP